jgi:hypothetical protein
MSTSTSTPATQTSPTTFRQKLANNAFTLPIILLFLLFAFNNWMSSYDLAFPMKAWLFVTNVGVVLVGVGMCGARLAGETKVKEG